MLRRACDGARLSNTAPRYKHSFRGVIDVLNATAAQGESIGFSCKKNTAFARENDVRPAQGQDKKFSADAHQVKVEIT